MLVCVLGRQLREEPLAQEGEEEEAMAALLRDILTDKSAHVPSGEAAAADAMAAAEVAVTKEQAVMGGERLSEGVVIPERPRGRVLRLYIWSTWWLPPLLSQPLRLPKPAAPLTLPLSRGCEHTVALARMPYRPP